jgi:hypothetical protein
LKIKLPTIFRNGRLTVFSRNEAYRMLINQVPRQPRPYRAIPEHHFYRPAYAPVCPVAEEREYFYA